MRLFFTSSITRIANKFALRVIWTCKKFSNAKLWLEKAIKIYFFDSDRRFEFRRIRDIRVRSIESRLYMKNCDRPCMKSEYLKTNFKRALPKCHIYWTRRQPSEVGLEKRNHGVLNPSCRRTVKEGNVVANTTVNQTSIRLEKNMSVSGNCLKKFR